MLYESRDRLLALLGELPDEASVPVGWLRKRLATEASPPSLMLTCAEFAAQHRPVRSSEWARRHCRSGHLTGATKVGGDWLIPAALLDEKSYENHVLKE